MGLQSVQFPPGNWVTPAGSEVPAEPALVREAGVRGDLRQGEVVASPQELLRPPDAAREDVPVRGQTGSRLELPCEVVGAESGDRSLLLRLPRPARMVRPNA
jgi:hypothetical protein